MYASAVLDFVRSSLPARPQVVLAQPHLVVWAQESYQHSHTISSGLKRKGGRRESCLYSALLLKLRSRLTPWPFPTIFNTQCYMIPNGTFLALDRAEVKVWNVTRAATYRVKTIRRLSRQLSFVLCVISTQSARGGDINKLPSHRVSLFSLLLPFLGISCVLPLYVLFSTTLLLRIWRLQCSKQASCGHYSCRTQKILKPLRARARLL